MKRKSKLRSIGITAAPSMDAIILSSIIPGLILTIHGIRQMGQAVMMGFFALLAIAARWELAEVEPGTAQSTALLEYQAATALLTSIRLP